MDGQPERRHARRAVLQQHIRTAIEHTRKGEQFSILALSGGGQYGAFGAGFLKGWSERTMPPLRPKKFDVVTGTSTGSLLATFAFLGSAWDETIGRAYLDITGDKDIFTKRHLISLLWSDSVSTRAQFRERLDGLITQKVTDAVADEGANGRCLFIGSVDLLGGEFHEFNLTEIAQPRTEAARRAYVDAIMASTAIPVQFPPVVLPDPAAPGGSITYVDGGIRRSIFAEALASALDESPEPPPATIYCLVNGARDVARATAFRFPKLLSMAYRSSEILLNESTEGNLFRIFLWAQRQQPRIEFKVTAIPPDVATKCDVGAFKPDELFDHKLMQCLYDEGRAFAKLDARPWQDNPLDGSP